MKKGKTCEVCCNYKIRTEKADLARSCYKVDAATFEHETLSDTYLASLDLQKVLRRERGVRPQISDFLDFCASLWYFR